MSLLDKIKNVGKAIEREVSNATRVAPQEILKVVIAFNNVPQEVIEEAAKETMKDVGSVAKDVGTSATRIVTDTGLDAD